MINKLKNITNTEDKKRLLSNFFSLSVLQALTYILPLLTLPYLVRVLGVDKFGLVMFAQAFIIFFNILVDFGFNLSATREIAVNRDDKEKVTEIFSSVMQIKFILIVISFLLLSIIVFSFEKFSNDWELYYFTFLMVIGQAFFPIWYFQGMEKMKYITIVNITSKFIFTIAIFIFVQDEANYILVPIFNGFGFIIGGLISLWIVYKEFNQSFIFQSFNNLIPYFRDSSRFFIANFSVTIYTSANAFILGLFTNNTMVGYYSIAEKLFMALKSLYQPVANTLYPYIAKERNIKLFKKIFYSVVVLNLVVIICFYFFGDYVFTLLFTQEIGIESIKVFHILLVANLIVVPSILIGYPFLGALGYAKYANMSVIYASFVHLSGLILLALTNNITIYNVAIMVIITQIVDFTYRFYGLYKHKLWNTKKEGII